MTESRADLGALLAALADLAASRKELERALSAAQHIAAEQPFYPDTHTGKRQGWVRAEIARKIGQLREILTPSTGEEMELVNGVDVLLDSTNNWGDRSTQVVRPIGIKFGSNEWDPDRQWLLVAWDFRRKATHTFPMKNVRRWIPPGPRGSFALTAPDTEAALPQWQTIETAPDSEEDIKVWAWNKDNPHRGVEAVYADGDYWRYARKIGETSVPSHWMAIDVPAPPEVKP
jgi:hypothetical protein